ncbi:MAG: hypothetical protein [Bacteriophage sp.]|nr:MAG: hypothetical protein [Bacteriophage sp.]
MPKWIRPDGYSSWSGMKQRCTNPKHPKFRHYGGRGIKVCERWQSYDNFISDMGPRPSLKHSVERKDNEGDYTPGNCVWATQTTQCNNRRTRKDNTLGERGVSLHPCGLYYVKLTRDGRTHVSRGIKSLADAIELRDFMLGELT